jgi:hypothetical protein
MIGTVVIPAIIALLVNEFCDVSPWLARRIVRWSAACRYRDPHRAEARAEELAALIDNRPGNLFKVITACCFAASAAGSRLPSAAAKLRAMIAGRTWQRPSEVVIGSIIAICGTGGGVSNIWTMAARGHAISAVTVAGIICISLSWLAMGVMIAAAKSRPAGLPGIPFGIATGNMILYAGTGSGFHLFLGIFFLFLSVVGAVRMLALRRDLRELVLGHQAAVPDCRECARFGLNGHGRHGRLRPADM